MLHKDVVLKARLKPSLDEAYTVIGFIEGKLTTLKSTQQKLQANNSRAVTEKMVKDTKQAVVQCIDEDAII